MVGEPAPLRFLRALDLTCTDFSDDHPLAPLPNLEQVDLAGTLIRDAGRLARSWSRLKRLNLYRSSAESLDGLEQLELEALNIKSTRVKASALTSLRSARPGLEVTGKPRRA
jgi:Leucine-rich repeat (LRR) protein